MGGRGQCGIGIVQLVLGLALLAAPARAQVSFETLALSGQTAPGAGGGEFAAFGVPTLNARGDVAFHATLEDGVGGVDAESDTGIWLLLEGGTLAARAREGSEIESGADPGDAYGQIFKSSGHPRIDATGRIAFSGRHRHFTATQSTDYLALFGPGAGAGSLALLATAWPLAPGGAPGVSARFSSFEPPAMNDAGQLAFAASLTGTGVNAGNDDGVWLCDGGAVSLFHREGNAAPGQPGNTLGPPFDPIQIAADGTPGFRATMFPAQDEYSRDTIWGPDLSGVFGLRVQTRQTPPPGGGPLDILISISVPRMNDEGNLSFYGRVGPFGGGPGIYNSFRSEDDDTLARVATQGELPHGLPGASLGFPETPVFNSTGEGVYAASFDEGGTPGEGLWAGPGFPLLVRSGDAPIGLPAGLELEAIDAPKINDPGHIVFAATLDPAGAGAGEDEVLVTIPSDGEPLLVVREGQGFQVAPGDVRTVASIDHVPSALADADHRHQVQDDSGRIVFRLGFGDGSSGVFRATPVTGFVPLPVGDGIVLLLSIGLAVTGLGAVHRSSAARTARSSTAAARPGS